MKLGLFKKRTLWWPTWKGWLVGFLLFTFVCGGLFFASHDFLAVSKPAPGAKTLVVEAWVADTSMEAVSKLLLAADSPYESVWLTGPVFDRGFYISEEYKTFSDMAAGTLKALGVPAEKIRIAEASTSQRHRTWDATRLLKEAFEAKGGVPTAFDIATVDVHTRRSRLVAKKVFADETTEIGVIALPPSGYDPERWFASSSGMKNTIFEIIAYSYEKLGNSGR